MVRKVLSRIFKSFSNGSNISTCSIVIKPDKLIDNRQGPLEADLVSIRSSRCKRLKGITLVLNPGCHSFGKGLKITCSPTEFLSVANFAEDFDDVGNLLRRRWTIDSFDTEFSVHCQAGPDRWEGRAFFKKSLQAKVA